MRQKNQVPPLRVMSSMAILAFLLSLSDTRSSFRPPVSPLTYPSSLLHNRFPFSLSVLASWIAVLLLLLIYPTSLPYVPVSPCRVSVLVRGYPSFGPPFRANVLPYG